MLGGTPTSGTGPDGANTGTTYIYFEGSTMSNNNEGHVKINQISNEDKILSFAYHANGNG